jgi:hypothetical protein
MAMPGTQGTKATAMVVMGVGTLFTAILLPKLSEFQLGPGGFRTKLNAQDAPSVAPLDTDPETLSRFATLVSGDPILARSLVEEALVWTKRNHLGVNGRAHAVFTVQTLLQLLEASPARQWLRGGAKRRLTKDRDDHSTGELDPEIRAALSGLSFSSRAVFVMKTEWLLSLQDMATLMEKPISDVQADLSHAYEALGPLLAGAES